jgi:lipopolysaccharide transport system permease protein
MSDSNSFLARAQNKSGVLKSLLTHHVLIFQLTKRSIVGRYRGSIAGIAWSLVIPLLMLAVYTLVFGFIFQFRFKQGEGGSNTDFALFLFTGIVVHGLLSECLNRAPGTIVNNAQYVKKIVFPVECLAWISVFTALFQTTISIFVLTVFLLLVKGTIYWTVLLIPLIFAPLVIVSVGLVWIIGGLSVYVRDLAQLTGVLSTLLLFLAPIFYPVSALPANLQSFIYINPIAFIVEQTRKVVIDGVQPNWFGLLIYSVIAIGIAVVGLKLFQRMRRGFADAL